VKLTWPVTAGIGTAAVIGALAVGVSQAALAASASVPVPGVRVAAGHQGPADRGSAPAGVRAAAAAPLTAAPTRAARSFDGVLKPGQMLRPGQSVHSPSRRFELVQQTDGNLVLYHLANGKKGALWGTMTASPGAFTVMQTDGNLVVYSKSRKALWASNTSRHGGAFLQVQNDGNVVVYSKAKKALWSRHEFIGELPPGYRLKPGMVVLSPSRRFFLVQQTDGNLVLYRGSLFGEKTALWGTMTLSAGAFSQLQTDGNLVVYSTSHKPLWASGTSHHAGAFLEVQNDGNVVVYSKAKKALWATHT